MTHTDESPQNQVLVIDKAVRLLEEFRSADTLTLTDLSERLGMSKSTVHRLLSSLEQVGFVSIQMGGEGGLNSFKPSTERAVWA